MTATSPVASPDFVDATINTEVESFSTWLDAHDLDKLTFYVDVTKVSTPGNLTLTLEVSPDSAEELNKASPSGTISGDYDKIITDAGYDSPAASVALSATGFDVFSISPEDSIRSVRIGMVSAATTDGTKYWTVVIGYSGLPRR